MTSTANQTPGVPSGAPGVSRDPLFRSVVVIVLMLVALLGVVHLPTAFSGDAALYQLGARVMDAGGVLYRDHWDLKSPGIYAFHWVAGLLFGFHEEGVHLLEWLLLLVLCVGQSLLLARHIRPRVLAALGPIASIGTYYAVSTEWHLTQPAVLLGAPLFAMLVLIGTEKASIGRWFVAGVAGAVALTLKPYAVGIVLTMAATGCWLRARTAAEAPGKLLRARAVPFVIGLLGSLVATFGAMAAAGGLSDFLGAHGEWRAAAALVRGGFPLANALGGAETFVRTFAPWLLLSLVAWLRWRSVAEERHFVLAAAWLFSGVAMTMIEPFAGWEFDFLVLIVPVGLLAARGAHGILGAWASRPERSADRQAAALLVGAVVLVALTGGRPLAERTRLWLRHLPLSQAAGATLRTTHDRRAARFWRESALLREPTSRSGAVYVFGDPLRQLYAERPAASPIHGWAWELQPTAMWTRVARDLDTAPAAYVYVSNEYERLIAERAPPMQRLLAERYRPLLESADGRWYERAD
ncbi:MAG: hypothetical protein ACKVS7_16245 [Gemmatimonadaceae bacterium]